MRADELTGSSKLSLAALRAALESVLKGNSASDSLALAADLAAARAALDSSSGLRRALTDPARGNQAKSDLVKDLFGKVVSPSALSLIQDASALRWSSGSDLSDALEVMTIEALAISAETAGESEALEGEILAIVRSIAASSDLRQALNDPKYSIDAKQKLIAQLFKGEIAGSTSECRARFGALQSRDLGPQGTNRRARQERSRSRRTASFETWLRSGEGGGPKGSRRCRGRSTRDGWYLGSDR